MIVKSYAKINTLLYVLGKRNDGYHEIFTLMHKIDLHDVIEIKKTSYGIDIKTTIDELNDSKNLAYRAAELFFETTRIKSGVRIEIEKHIPIGGGLGGGSSNAAYTLKSLNEMFGFPLNKKELFKLGANLGSDVAFFIEDGSCIATGRGEKIKRLNCDYGDFKVALVVPDISISTAFVYKNLRLTNHTGFNKIATTVEDGCSIEFLKSRLYNDLEAVVLEKFDLLKTIKETLVELAGNGLVSGSGSAVFSIINSEVQQERLAETFGGMGLNFKTFNFVE
ncbi:4-(cytidine 5'-diphospho)-2-C-methyl-D-erythritol kinase [Hippea jasoniae]|uniref:4-(cytidine 5'-diphospho)-2-C-methyl-D-erythritol kinase n=1 Tax=Hippea jasoniae TaxID=944479 RepID=UPI00068AC4C1|nr:4-(cytidine 5'-diphospho)-2-C-methyl-D-erythritol kinase [Hippea jasoniae]